MSERRDICLFCSIMVPPLNIVDSLAYVLHFCWTTGVNSEIVPQATNSAFTVSDGDCC